jgi:hypothetical protein
MVAKFTPSSLSIQKTRHENFALQRAKLEWTALAQERDYLWTVVDAMMKLQVPWPRHSSSC